MDFEDSYRLGQFYYDYLNTNPIIDAAEHLAHNNPDLLKELALQLKEESSNLIDNLEKNKDVDFIKIADEHVRKYFEQAQTAADKYNPFYKEYKDLERRLDYTDPTSEEYEEAEKECNEAKAIQDKLQENVKRLYAKRDKGVKRSANLFDLEYSLLIYIATKLNRIAGNILLDLESLGKEGIL